MANQTIEFVKNLSGAYPRFPMTAETRDLYVRKLGSWKFSQAQWDQVLIDIMAARENEQSIPALGEIYPHLKSVQQAANDHRYGWITFLLGDERKATRVYNQDGKWMVLAIERDIHGDNRWKVDYTGRKAAVPQGATCIHIVPDDPAPDDLEDHRGEISQLLNHYGEVDKATP